jgi:hypothetical protein
MKCNGRAEFVWLQHEKRSAIFCTAAMVWFWRRPPVTRRNSPFIDGVRPSPAKSPMGQNKRDRNAFDK